MTIKIIWTFIGLNTLALLVFIGASIVMNAGRHVDYMEKGWTVILAGAGVLVILLAAVTLRVSQSGFAVLFAGFFALLPSVAGLGFFLSSKLPELTAKKTFAETYYTDKTQRSIAAAIEQNDTARLKTLIAGQDLNIQGNRVWDREGLTYLQFAIRLRSNPLSFPFDEAANTAAIRILTERGAAATPALVEGVRYLPVQTLGLLLDAGADPNVTSYYDNEPLLFNTIDPSVEQTDKAILLVRKGAAVNAQNSMGLTPAMYAAERAQTSKNWHEAWRFVRFLLAEGHADFLYTAKDGNSLQNIIRSIREKAAADNITMPPDFLAVVEWLTQHHVPTDPAVKV